MARGGQTRTEVIGPVFGIGVLLVEVGVGSKRGHVWRACNASHFWKPCPDAVRGEKVRWWREQGAGSYVASRLRVAGRTVGCIQSLGCPLACTAPKVLVCCSGARCVLDEILTCFGFPCAAKTRGSGSVLLSHPLVSGTRPARSGRNHFVQHCLAWFVNIEKFF